MAAAAVVMPHLDDGIVSEILYRLPSNDAYRLAAVCRQWRAMLCQPTFLCRHLSPRPLPLLDDGPYALIIQPRRGTSFTHLRLVAVDPADSVPVNVPVQPKYVNPKPPPRRNVEPSPRMNRDPAPPLFDIAKDNSVFRLLDPDGADDLGDDDDESDDPDVPAELLELLELLTDGPISSDLTSTTTMMEISTMEEPTPPPPPALENYVVFFERTIPMLDISVVASHGRLLLCRSRSRYYVCDPAANRWLALPRSSISPSSDANYGLHYEVEASRGRLAFTAVLLDRRRRRRVLVDTFSSATGRWDPRELPTHGAAHCLPAASPGIHVGTCFYWLSRRWRRGGQDLGRRILRYDAAQCRASLLREPPLADNAKDRMGRSLGSVDGRLRMCAFDIRDESESMMPHGDDDTMEGVHGVWLMDSSAAAAWRRVHEATVEDVSAYYFNMVFGAETPVDFAGACSEFVMVEKWAKLLRYDLDSGSKVKLASLEQDSQRLGALYRGRGRGYNAFPFFK